MTANVKEIIINNNNNNNNNLFWWGYWAIKRYNN